MDIVTVVEKFGLAVGLLVYFIWRDYQTSKEHKADMRDIAIKSVQAIDKGTEALNDSTEVIRTNNGVISENTNIINRIKGVLSTRSRSLDNDGGN